MMRESDEAMAVGKASRQAVVSQTSRRSVLRVGNLKRWTTGEIWAVQWDLPGGRNPRRKIVPGG